MGRVTDEHPPYHEVKAAFPLYPSFVLMEFETGEYRVHDFSRFFGQSGEMIAPLPQWDFFRKVRVDEGTLVFPNGLDFDPAVLYAESQPFDVRKAMD